MHIGKSAKKIIKNYLCNHIVHIFTLSVVYHVQIYSPKNAVQILSLNNFKIEVLVRVLSKVKDRSQQSHIERPFITWTSSTCQKKWLQYLKVSIGCSYKYVCFSEIVADRIVTAVIDQSLQVYILQYTYTVYICNGKSAFASCGKVQCNHRQSILLVKKRFVCN